MQQQFQACDRALGNRVHGAMAFGGGIDAAAGAVGSGFGNHDQADQDRRRRADHRGDHEMRGGIGDHRRQQRGIERQHRAGDAGHAASHDQEQLAAGQLGEVGPDEQRRFHHAQEHIGSGRQPDRAADPKGAAEQPGQAAHDRRQDAPVEQQRGQHAHHQHDRQRLQGQDEGGIGIGDVERQRAAAEIAEHKACAGPGRAGDRPDRVVDHVKGMGHARQLEQHERGAKRRQHADRDLSERHRTTVFAERPRNHEQSENAERRL